MKLYAGSVEPHRWLHNDRSSYPSLIELKEVWQDRQGQDGYQGVLRNAQVQSHL